MDATPTRYIIINARNTDGYTIIREYGDGSQDNGTGYYSSIESAIEDCTDESLPLVNGTSDWTNDDALNLLGIRFDA